MKNFISLKVILIAVSFLAVLALATQLILLRFSDDIKNTDDTPPAGEVKVSDDDKVDEVLENVVVYGDSGFSQRTISIAASRGLGCVINVQNKSSQPLNLGMSPHKTPKDPGREYPAIEPGGRLLFDPRFTGFTQLSFHDHEHPESEFLVKFERSCR